MASNKKIKGVVKYLLLLALAAVLVYFAFRKVEWSAFVGGLKQTRWVWVVFFCIASVVALVFRTIRWKELILPFDSDIKSIKVWDAVNVGNLVSLVLPGSGEFLRCGYVASKKFEYDKSLGTMFCERLWDAIAIVVLTATSLIYESKRLGDYFSESILAPVSGRSTVFWLIALAIVLLAAFVLLAFKLRARNLFFSRVADSLTRLWSGFTAYKKSDNKLMIAVSTFVIWLMYVLMCYCIIKALPASAHLNFMDAMFLSAIGNFASIIPVPGGIGAYHYLVATALILYDVSWDLGILFATLNHEIHAVLIAIVGLFAYLHWVRERKLTS